MLLPTVPADHFCFTRPAPLPTLARVNEELQRSIDYMLARPYPTRRDLADHCVAAQSGGYRAVLVPTSLASDARELLDGTPLKLICAIGFPFGTMDSDAKRFETEVAADAGAHEIELVPSISRLLENDTRPVLREIRDIVEAADERPVNVVIESHLWSEDQLAEIISLVLDSGAHFLSTTIALQGRHASVDAVHHLRELAGDKFGLKVGGLRTLDGAENLLSAGANRIGLSA